MKRFKVQKIFLGDSKKNIKNPTDSAASLALLSKAPRSHGVIDTDILLYNLLSKLMIQVKKIPITHTKTLLLEQLLPK